MPDTTCNTCGGSDFYKEAGFYFCSECQTQIQELQEQEFEHGDETIIVHKTKKIRSLSSSKTPKQQQITSWECYNYILLGLVNELIELGASKDIKPIVQTIWLQYLRKIEVLHQDVNKAPNLPAFHHKHDAKIICGRYNKKKVYKRKRRDSCTSASTDFSNPGSSQSLKEQKRLKRAMAEKAYETQSTQQSDSSLLNISLGSLKSSQADKYQLKDSFLHFNKEAKEELLHHMTKTHLKEHVEDIDSALVCHDLSYRTVSKAYKKGTNMMTQTKLYSILYIALLIKKDKIQLGDVIRFMSEGSLSYNYYQHFFPEDVDHQTKFINNFKISKVASHETYRDYASKLVHFLDLKDNIPTQNLIELIRRYCKELNLPNELGDYAVNFLSEMQPKMKVHGKMLPNYEARAMCIIIFVLKLIFGLDDVTEIKFSHFADFLNTDYFPNNEDNDKEMFNFELWLKFICYRRLVLARHHFPTQFAEKQFSCDDYLDFINAYFHKYDIQREEDNDYDVISRLVFKNSAYEQKSSIQFDPSLTPLHDNLKTLYESNILQNKNYLLDNLLQNFVDTSLEYLINSNRFLDSKSSKIVNHGANSDIKIVPVAQPTRVTYTKFNSSVTCKLSRKKPTIPNYDVTGELDTDTIIEFFNHLHQGKFNDSLNMQLEYSKLYIKEYSKHYKPERRFWLRLGTDIGNMNMEDFERFFLGFPYHFRLIVKECASITCQSVKDLLIEYNYFESYVCYNNLFKYKGAKKRDRKKESEITLMRLVKHAKDHW